MPGDSATLSTQEQADLRRLESVVRMHLPSACEAWAALAEIKERALHRQTHRTFVAYLKDVWNLSKSEAYRRIQYSGVYKALNKTSPIGDSEPVSPTPSQARHVAQETAKARSPATTSERDALVRQIWARINREESEGDPPTEKTTKDLDTRAKVGKSMLKVIGLVERWSIEPEKKSYILEHLRLAATCAEEAVEA